jgi:hypothetical protein
MNRELEKFLQASIEVIISVIAELAIYLIFLLLVALVGGIGFAYITFGIGALLLLLPYALLIYVIYKKLTQN